MSGQVLFEVDGVSKRYRLPRTSLLRSPAELTAVDDVSLRLHRGESLGVVGESGSGKTTLMRLLLGLERPDGGTVAYRGGSLRREVQVVLQDPGSALDVSVRAQILNLLQDLRVSFDLTLVLVSHDLSVVRQMCDRVLVMYRGQVVEEGETRALFRDPRHPYTRALLESIPTLRKRRAASA